MKSLLTSVSFAALVAFSLPAAAQSIILGPSTGLPSQVCDLTSNVGGTITDQCIPAKGTASFGSASGPYTVGSMPNKKPQAIFGPATTSQPTLLPASGDTSQSFSYGPDSAGNQTVGTIDWMVLDSQGTLTGTYTPTVAVGSAAFTAVFKTNQGYQASLTYAGGFPIMTLLSTPSKSGEVSIGSGKISGATAQCTTVTQTICNPN